MRRLLVGLALLPCLVGTPRAEEPAPKPVVVPFELFKSGHMTVMVKVNGQGPYRLIFDTGAPVNVLSTKIGKDAGLTKGGARPALAPFGALGAVTVKTLEVGAQKVEEISAVVLDHPTVAA